MSDELKAIFQQDEDLSQKTEFSNVKSTFKESRKEDKKSTAIFRITMNTNIPKHTLEQRKEYESTVNSLLQNDVYYLLKEAPGNQFPFNKESLVNPDGILKIKTEVSHEIGTLKNCLHSHATIAVLLKSGYKIHMNIELCNELLTDIRNKVFKTTGKKRAYFKIDKAFHDDNFQWNQYLNK